MKILLFLLYLNVLQMCVFLLHNKFICAFTFQYFSLLFSLNELFHMGERESSGSDGKTNVNHPGSNTVAFIVQNM